MRDSVSRRRSTPPSTHTDLAPAIAKPRAACGHDDIFARDRKSRVTSSTDVSKLVADDDAGYADAFVREVK